MKRFTPAIVFALLFAATALVGPAAAQEPRAADISILAINIDAPDDPLEISAHIEVEVTSYNTASSAGGDPASSCNGGAVPSETVWLAFAVPSGKATLSLAGSNITTSPAGSTMIVTLYRGTTEIACASGNNAAAPIISNAPTTPGIYTVVIGVPNGTTVTAGSLYLTYDFVPSVKISNDTFAKAKTLKYPSNPTVPNLENATYDDDEIVSSCADSTRPSNSVWYKFSSPRPIFIQYFVTYAQGLGFNGISSTSFLLTVFEQTEFGLSELVCIEDQATPLISGLLPAGSYYIRLEPDVSGGLSAVGLISSSVNPSISKGIPNFKDADTVAPDFSGWKAKNADLDDGVVCDLDSCSYVFTSIGAGEKSEISTSADMSKLSLKKNDLISIGIQYSGTTPNGKAEVTISYSDGTPKTKLALELQGDAVGAASVLLKSTAITSIKLKIRNLDTTLGDTLQIDSAFLSTLRLGEMTPRGPLPLPAAPAM